MTLRELTEAVAKMRPDVWGACVRAQRWVDKGVVRESKEDRFSVALVHGEYDCETITAPTPEALLNKLAFGEPELTDIELGGGE